MCGHHGKTIQSDTGNIEISKKISVRTVMTLTPITIGDDQSLDAAKHLMASHGIRHLPVLHGGRCVGILSDRDIKLAYAVEPQTAKDMLVKDTFTDDVYTVTPCESVQTIAATLAERGIGSAVVVERDRVVGIFTLIDVCRVLARILPAHPEKCGNCDSKEDAVGIGSTSIS